MKNNEIQVVDKKSYGMRMSKNDRTVEFSPEISQRICTEMISLGTQLILETGRVTVEYFQTQAAIYYAQLNAYIQNQTLKSEERKLLIGTIEKVTDKYIDLINEAENLEKRETLISTYNMLVDKYSKLYMQALDKDVSTQMPKKGNFFSIIRELIAHNK